MRRATDRFPNESFDLLIIGGGITGACVARDAARRGLKVALAERGDFAGATSAHNSRLVHGGLRYLRNFELGLVRESLRERRIWQTIAPHLVHPLPFLVPLFGAGARARLTLAAGLTLYDLLSYDRNRVPFEGQRMPGHSWLGAAEARAIEPILDSPGLSGAFAYYDAQMHPEQLALACLIDAGAHGAALANYVEAESLILGGGRAQGARLRDRMTGTAFEIRAKATLVAAGPWADIFLRRALDHPPSHKLLRSKGIHLVVPAMTRGHALTVAAEHGHFFVLPWGSGHTLLGTTDTAFTGDPDHVGVSETDIAGFLAFVNAHLANARLSRAQVQHFYAGLRPLVDDGSGDTYGASRRAELVDHAKDDGVDGLFSAIGGKWTTSRHLAETVVDRLVERLGIKADRCETARRPLPVVPADALAPSVRRAVQEHMALTLEDVVMRRLELGLTGPAPVAAVDEVSRVMAEALHWSEAHRQDQVAGLAHLYETVP